MDLSLPSIQLPKVRLQSMPSTLFSFIVKFVLYLSMRCEKRMKINKKRPGWRIFISIAFTCNCYIYGPHKIDSFFVVEIRLKQRFYYLAFKSSCNPANSHHHKRKTVLVWNSPRAYYYHKYFHCKSNKVPQQIFLFCFRQDVSCFGEDTCFSLAFGVPAALVNFCKQFEAWPVLHRVSAL